MTLRDEFFKAHVILSETAIPLAGSDRKYTRIQTDKGSYIVCENHQAEENKTFIYFAEHFKNIHAPVPEIVAVSEDHLSYIQTDGGLIDLLHYTQEHGFTDTVKSLYQEALTQLARLQVHGDKHLDYSRCFTSSAFDAYAVQADLNYFKYYFLDLSKISYNKIALQKEFEQWSALCGNIEPRYFMYRDFQGRNILVHEEALTFIDFQGGMKGPVHYDVASLLWQAKANLPLAWKNELLQHYLIALNELTPVNPTQFSVDYSRILLTRLLQVLGAYGLRGLIEQRAHFVSSIPFGLKNIQEWLSLYALPEFPEMQHILQQLSSEEFILRFK